MTSGAQTREGQFVEVNWGIYGVLIGSKVFLPSRWTMLKKVLTVRQNFSWAHDVTGPLLL
jgi:hypothetical protein